MQSTNEINKRHSRETNSHAPGGIRTRNPTKWPQEAWPLGLALFQYYKQKMVHLLAGFYGKT
jgi:hypothetical protein